VRIYVDTSVIGGYFEQEFQKYTEQLISKILKGDFTAVISDLTLAELGEAPLVVRNLADRIISENAEFVLAGEADRELAEKYLKERVVSPKSHSDALHIAIATINRVDVLVSWNFKHIVNLTRIRQYNSVNLKYGYSLIEIRNPMEII